MVDKSRNYGLDVTRCVAIMLVFIIHAIQNIFVPDIPFIWYLAYAGVELFFALSGFLIGKILFDMFISNNGRLTFANLKKFLIRRWLRTLPLYYFILLLLLLINFFLKIEVPHQWRYFFFLNNFNSTPLHFFGESWSLAIEEWFYLLFSSVLFIGASFLSIVSAQSMYKIKPAISFLILLLFFIGLTWVLKFFLLQSQISKEVFTIVLFRLDAIAYGILAYWIYHSFRIKKYHSSLILFVACAIILSAVIIRFTYPDFTSQGMTYYLLASIGYAAFVLALSIYPFKHTFWIVSHISKISYSIYITHLSLILLPLLKFYTLSTTSQKGLFLAVYILLTYVVSLITYNIIEKPFNAIRNRLFKNDLKLK